MKMTRPLTLLLTALLLAPLAGLPAASAKQPNVLLIITDDQAAVFVFKGGMVQIMLPKKAVPGERDVMESGSPVEAPTSHRFAAWH